ncbi:thiamine pyrophosphate-binding protein [Pseudothioglobus sp. nBUS_23]|uniref:thiamine pyrophosphate-binding protein n=1 Tax=Pseudothioglobus sp. nBUS_23 TaxID=3395318 RepID=UPI003EBEAFBB
MKYSDQLAEWLLEMGYTHCFFVSGGNSMHLVESFSRKLDCRAVIHEVAAGIAAEYFNESSEEGKALALVTAGPGITNIISAIAGAYLESRELLVIGGQVKTFDLSLGKLRQNGIQEIDGVSIASSICSSSTTMTQAWNKEKFGKFICSSENGRKSPVFLEIPLDIQAKNVDFTNKIYEPKVHNFKSITQSQLFRLVSRIKSSQRPIIMIGGGLSRETATEIQNLFTDSSVPFVTTWNGMDRIGSNNPNYVGRPNTWGQRSANVLLQQADLLVAFGTRLGMQQTGFNWQEFIPNGKIIQIDIDKNELEKGHPKIDLGLELDANDTIIKLLKSELGDHTVWLKFCKKVRNLLPLVENSTLNNRSEFISPHLFVQKLSQIACKDDIVIPCSSGGAFTIMMQVFEQKFGQKIITNKGLASMGYGLSGAIGASIANPNKRVFLIEGDGSFSQNLQEIGTAAINNCNLKIFIFDDGGYASIRMTQRNYFNGRYVGCDTLTGLGLPDWKKLFEAWNVPVVKISAKSFKEKSIEVNLEEPGFAAFIIPIDPEQTYLPKITSQLSEARGMISNPLHLMTPDIEEPIKSEVFKYILKE